MSIRNIDSASFVSDFQKNFKQGMNKINKDGERITDGYRHTDFKSAAESGDIEEILGFEREESGINNFQKQNRMALVKANTVHSVLDKIIDRVTDLNSEFILRNDVIADSMGFVEIAKSGLEELQGLLNFNFNDEYVFSGSMIDTPAVKDLVTDADLQRGILTSNYYQGDDNLDSIKVNSNVIVKIGVTANDSGFKKVIAGIHLGIAGHIKRDSGKLIKAKEFLAQGIREISAARVNLGNNIARIENAENDNDNIIMNLKESLDGVQSISPEEAMLSFKNRITRMEALTSFYSKIDQLNLDTINKFS